MARINKNGALIGGALLCALAVSFGTLLPAAAGTAAMGSGVSGSGPSRTLPVTARWSLTKAPDGATFSGLSCGSTGFCVAIPASQAGLEISHDFGLSWQPSVLPSGDYPSGPLSCTGTASCVVGVSTSDETADPVATSDGGQSWVDAGYLVNFALYFIDAVSCAGGKFCLVAAYDEESPELGNDIWSTDDGGRTWADVSVLPDPAQTGGGPVALSCVSDTTCFAAGPDAFSVTSNGGRTWTTPGSGPPDAIFPNQMDCPTVKQCVVVGTASSGPINPPDYGAIAVTSNGGKSWQLGSLPPGDEDVTGVSCVSAATCWAVATVFNGGRIFSDVLGSTDGGLAWTSQLADFSASLSSIACFQPGTCLAVGNGRIARLISSPVVAVAATPDGKGYFLAAADGKVYARGDARFYGDMSGKPLAAPIVAMAVDPATGGYWLLGADGGVFSFHAAFFGSTGAMHLHAPAVGMEATPKGDGYRFVASDGGVFDFGRGARFYGSMGGRQLNKPVVAMADDPATGGYWLVASDGGVFSFHARFLGSAGSIHLKAPIVEIEALASGAGYRFAASGGAVFDFGAARYAGSLGTSQLTSPVVGVAGGTGPAGYWLAEANGLVTPFGGVASYGDA